MRKFWNRWKAKFALALLAVAVVLLALWPIRRDWGLLAPKDAISAWTLIAAVSAAAAAIATIAVAAFAYRGLRSIRLARNDMKNRAERESKLSAIQRLEELAKEIIPLNEPVLNAMSAAGIKVYLKPTEQVVFDPDPQDLSRPLAWVRALPAGAEAEIRRFLNRLEAWSTYFATGVADENVAFGAVAPLLRSWVGQYYPVLLLCRTHRRSGNFPNLVRLYKAWSDKMDAEALAALHRDVEKQLERRGKNQLPPPIGTDIDDE